MIRLDDSLLQQLGLGTLPPAEKNALLRHIYETLELRVGMQLAEKMSEDQLKEFEQLMPTESDTPDIRTQKEQSALTWLSTNFPNYKQVVADELEKLKSEIKQAAPQILAASQQATTQMSQTTTSPLTPGQMPPNTQQSSTTPQL